ncbi:MAG: hypothetical protein BGO32_11855 [Bacteroidetes bacterium 37-13]|nr:MAG: hypothetical protein BGO32_11855 [Bacteroidetes bacterium 37-13]
MSFLFSDWKLGKDIGILIFRLTFSLVLLYGHGFEKLTTVFSGQEIQFMDPIGIGSTFSFYLATFAEGVCAMLLALGLFTRMATIILIGNFLVIFSFHAFMVGDGFMILEPRIFYLASYVALFFTGGGAFSIDSMMLNKGK